jgi:preprotein translocase subunit SecE
VASRIPNRARTANSEEDVQESTMSEEQEFDDTLPTDEEAESLPVAVNSQSVAAAATVAAARRPWAENIPNWVPKYFRESLLELSKVTWPTNKEALNLTTIVVIFSIIFAVVFFAIDFGLTSLLQALTQRVHP